MRLTQLAAAAAITVTASFAGVTAEAKSISVSTNGLDLTDAQDVATLHQNLARAAFRACDDNGRMTLAERQLERECAMQALDASIANAGVATLAALHANLDASVRYSRGVRELSPTLVAAVNEAARATLAQNEGQFDIAAR